MIILDLTKVKRPPSWGKIDVPKKIRLEKGCHFYTYNIHPMCRNTKWYKELEKVLQADQQPQRPDWPVGLSKAQAKEAGAKIIEE